MHCVSVCPMQIHAPPLIHGVTFKALILLNNALKTKKYGAGDCSNYKSMKFNFGSLKGCMMPYKNLL